jgi:Flp pilus assembly protein TadG
MFPPQYPERELLMTSLRRVGCLRWRRGRRRDRGSMSVELAVIAPGLVLLLLLVGAGGRVVEAQGHVDGAARDAARSASLARSMGQANAFALQAARADLGGSSWCAQGTVAATVAGFPAVGQAVGPGDSVTVTVTCAINTSPFTILGFNPTTTFTAQAVAPLDPFMCRNAAC